MNKNQTCCFTGHRFIAGNKVENIKTALQKQIEKLAEQGIINFLCGGAIGFDTLAAQQVLFMRVNRELPIKLIMVLPCKNQDKYWSENDKSYYMDILNNANEIICLSENYYDGCMLARNRYMVDNSTHCIAYLIRNRGGTLYTVNYALSKKNPSYKFIRITSTKNQKCVKLNLL